MILADTSIWIDFFRGREPAAEHLDRALQEPGVVVCGPVAAELLAGTPAQAREALWLAIGSLPIVELTYADWTAAGQHAYTLRTRGVSVPLLDIMIGIAATRAGARLWTRDRDFDQLTPVVRGLRLYEP